MSQVAEKTRNSRRKFRKFVLSTFALVGLMAVCWSAYDLYLPQQLRMRDFDPAKVARLETGMWRSYYERRPINTFNQFAEALRTQFHLPVLRSIAIAYRASAAAFTFKAGHSRPDYEKALPDLIRFYVSVREASDIHFDPVRAAKFELEWWIIHRERDQHPPSDLVNALAELQAEIYQVPVDAVRVHAELRAQARLIRDTTADTGGVTESDWDNINKLLTSSWESLSVAVNRQNQDGQSTR